MSQNKPFFGWFVLSGLFINYMAVVGICIYTLPLFYPFLIAEFGWNPSEVTRAATISFFAGAIITPIVSPFYDNYSARKIMIIGLVAILVGLLLYNGMSTINMMIGIYLLFALAQVCNGQVPVMVVTTRWFASNRGLAIGVVLTATSVGGAIFPLLIRSSLAENDWHGAIIILTIIAALLLTLPLIFLIRNRPEDLGQQAMGEEELQAKSIETGKKESAVTLKQALCSIEFYLLAFATGALWFCINGMVQHQSIIMGTELGVEGGDLALIISVYFWFAIIGKTGFGWLSDRFNKSLVMLKGVILLVVGFAILRFGGESQLYLYAAVFGLGFGGTFSMIQILIADFYAGENYGKILGVLTMVDVAAGGIAIPALANMQETAGSYMPVLEKLIWLAALIAISVVGLYWRQKKTLKMAVSV